MRIRGFAAGFTASVLLAPGLAGAALVRNISTGYDETAGSQLANNAQDTDFVVAPGSDEFTGQTLIARGFPLPAPYLPDTASTASRWDFINTGLGIEGTSVNGTLYNFQTGVDLTGYLPQTASITSARFAVDDVLASIRVNGVVVYTDAGNSSLSSFQSLPSNIGLGSFGPGQNTITFNLRNGSTLTPVALRFEGNVTATPFPEPGCLGLVLGAGSLLVRPRRR